MFPEKNEQDSYSPSGPTTATHRAHTAIVVDKQMEPQKPPMSTPTTPFPPSRKLMPNYNPPEEKLCECLPFGIFKSLWKVGHVFQTSAPGYQRFIIDLVVDVLKLMTRVLLREHETLLDCARRRPAIVAEFTTTTFRSRSSAVWVPTLLPCNIAACWSR
jgi:hypothetical protein